MTNEVNMMVMYIGSTASKQSQYQVGPAQLAWTNQQANSNRKTMGAIWIAASQIINAIVITLIIVF